MIFLPIALKVNERRTNIRNKGSSEFNSSYYNNLLFEWPPKMYDFESCIIKFVFETSNWRLLFGHNRNCIIVIRDKIYFWYMLYIQQYNLFSWDIIKRLLNFIQCYCMFQSHVVFKYHLFFMNATYIAQFIHLIHVYIRHLYLVGVITINSIRYWNPKFYLLN